jgi:hypothetical protein
VLQVSAAGKTVTATVDVRLKRALAGRTLRVAVQASDVHGQRQLDRLAGTILPAR